MSETYIDRLRETSRVEFCKDYRLPNESSLDWLMLNFGEKWIAYRAGFTAGCQFQLTECRNMVKGKDESHGTYILVSKHASLPDGE